MKKNQISENLKSFSLAELDILYRSEWVEHKHKKLVREEIFSRINDTFGYD